MKHKGRVRQRRKKGRGGNYKQTKWRFVGMLENIWKKSDPSHQIAEELVGGLISTFEDVRDGKVDIVEIPLRVYESEFGHGPQ